MTTHTVEDRVYHHKEWKRKVLFKLLRKKQMRKRFFNSDFFFQQIMEVSPICRQPLDILLKETPKVVLEDFISRNGNVSPYEIMTIASLISVKEPNYLLEIGTFDGNTTLQMALNAPVNATIHTIDLPKDHLFTKEPVLKSDMQFICDEHKHQRKFKGKSVASKIQEHFGDSTNYDFSTFIKQGSLDFVFIDGGHSYQCVQSDTNNVLECLSDTGWILWHDFTPHFGGVFQFLCELSETLSLTHIEGTNLVIYKKGENND